jgi:hypothetical protein
MGLLNTIGRWDNAVARQAAERVPVAATAAEQALANQIAKRQASYATRDVASVAPEVAALIGNQPTVARSEGADQAVLDAYAQARKALGYKANQSTEGVVVDDPRLLQKLEAVGIGSPAGDEASAQYQQLVAALAQADAAQNPALAVQIQRALGGVNQALADNVWARSGMYAGIGTGGVAAIPLVTEAGRGLMDLAQWLGGGQDETRYA